MPFFHPLRIAVLIAAALSPAASRAEDPPPVLDPASIDRSIPPCQDFYRFACGNWIKTNPIPPDRARWDRFASMFERNLGKLRAILEAAAAKPDGERRKIGDYYASCMDEAAIEARGLKPLRPELDRIAALRDRKGLPALVARQHGLGVGSFFALSSMQDFADATKVIADVDQGGLGLPDRDFYFRTDPKSIELRKAYVRHVANMFRLLGETPAAAERDAQRAMAIETDLAASSLERVKRRDPKNLDHKLQLRELVELTPDFAWQPYLQAVGEPGIESLNVSWPDFFTGLDRVVAVHDLAALKAYLRWHLVHSFAGALPKAFVDENFAFYGRTMSGTKEIQARWKRCVQATNGALGEALGKVYVEENFPPDAKAQALAMIRSVEAAYADDISGLDWMGDDTKRQALTKLAAIANKIGYPDKWRDYSKLRIARGDALGNATRAGAFEFGRRLDKIGKPVDRGEWYMSPPTVNAYYSGQYNDINFPAGILEPPFYRAGGDAAANYGAIGVVMGHEMTHGFDDEGRKFDDKGNLRDWWTPGDAAAFEKRANCIADEYGGFTAVDEVKVNGRLTLGENIADNGGFRLAYAALRRALAGGGPPDVDGFTAEQRVFIAYAQVWCNNTTPELKRRAAQTDAHSPGEFRVNGVILNQPEFAKAFACPAGVAMVPPPEKACRVW